MGLKPSWLLPFWLLAGLVAYGQKPFSGKVIDGESGAPLMMATVFIAQKQLGTTTDKAGFFRLPGRVQPADTVTVSYVGYQPARFVASRLWQDSLVHLNPNTVLLSEVTFISAKFNLNDFMQEVAETYRQQKPQQPHVGRARYEGYGKIDGSYAAYTASSGYVLFFGDSIPVARLALYAYLADKTNKSFSRPEWLKMSKFWQNMSLTDLPMDGGLSLNAFLYFEIHGPLFRPAKFKYRLDSIYQSGAEDVYIVSFKQKTVSGAVGPHARGRMTILANTWQIRQVWVSGSYLWSKVFHKRVAGEMVYAFSYYNGRPYITSASSYYRYKGVEEKTLLQITAQKYAPFSFTTYELFRLKEWDSNPLVVPDKGLTGQNLLGVDMQRLYSDLGYKEPLPRQFALNGDKPYFNFQEGARVKAPLPTKDSEMTLLFNRVKVFFE